MGTYLSRGALSLIYSPQPNSDWPVGLGFPHLAGRFRPGGSSFSSPGCRSCKGMEIYIINPRMGTYSPRGPLSLMYDPPPIRYRPVRMWLPHHAGRFRPGGSPFSSPGCRSCRCMEIFLIPEWVLSSPGGADFIPEPQPISYRPADLGFLHRAGWFRPGESPFSTPDCRNCRYMEGFLNRKWGPILPGAARS